MTLTQHRALWLMGGGVLSLVLLKQLFPLALRISPLTYVGWYLVALACGVLAMWRGTQTMLEDDGRQTWLLLGQWFLLLVVLFLQVVDATELFVQFLRPFQARGLS